MTRRKGGLNETIWEAVFIQEEQLLPDHESRLEGLPMLTCSQPYLSLLWRRVVSRF